MQSLKYICFKTDKVKPSACRGEKTSMFKGQRKETTLYVNFVCKVN